MKFVVILTDSYGGKENQVALIVDASDRPSAIRIACDTPSHAERVSLQRAEVHPLLYEGVIGA